MEKPKYHNKEKIAARNMAEVTLKRVGKYEDLAAADANDGEKLLREKTAELWRHFVVQGQITNDGVLPFAGDLDAKGSVFLLTQSGILSQKKFEVYERTIETKLDIPHPRSEFKYRKNKGRTRKFAEEVISKSEKYEDLNSERLEGGIKKFNKKELEIRSTPGWSLDKDVKIITYVPAGQILVGGIHFDTGNKEGVVVDEDGTAYFDHHGKDSDLTSSATKNLYKGLVREGMLKSDRGMEKMVEFITQMDNGTFPHAETYFPVFDQTIIGLQRFIRPETLYKFFQEGNNPKKVLSAQEIKKLGLEEESKNQKKLQEATKEGFEKLKAEGFIVETKAGGKALININKNWSGDYLAAKYFKCDTYIIWSPEQQSFFVSNNEKGLEFNLPQGVNVRGKMWIKPRADGKPLEISLKDILSRIVPPDFKPQGKLAEYLESEPTKSYNAENMNPEIPKKPAPPTAETTPPPFSQKPEPPTPEMLAALAAQDKSIEEPEIEAVKLWTPEPESKKEETKEAIPEKSRIELAREAYLSAKSDFESKKKSIEESMRLTDADAEASFNNSPIGKALMEKFNLSREEYFGARSEELGKVLEKIESEFKEKGMTGEELSKEMKKASSAYFISEFKNLYDAQTEMLAAQKQETAATWIGKKIYEMGDAYRKMPLKKKLAYSAALIGAGVVAGSVGGTVGTALAAIAGGGHISQRILGATGAFVGLEGLIKKSQEGEFNLKESAKFSEVSEKVFEGTVAGKKDELLAYLKSRDKDLESMGWAADKDVRDIEKSLANRRYLVAGSMGALIGSGATAEALSSVFNGLGLNEVMEKLSAKLHYSEVEPISGAESPAKIIEEVSKESRAIATIEKGGSVSQAARSFMESTGMSNEEFKQVWENSFVDVNGIKVPIKDISLVHEGDQVVLVRDAAGVGHFEVLDYAQDKVGIGTNQELYDMYETSGKEAPVWLEKAVSEDVSDAFKDNNLDANDTRVIEFHYKHGSLDDQMAIQEKLMDKMALATSDARPFSEMFVKLSSSPEHATAMEQFSNHLAASGFASQDSAEFLAIKNVTVGELLEKRGGSWFKDYFFPSELNDSNGEKVAKVSIKVQRKLAEYIRWQATDADKSLTVEKFLKKLS